jgi:hypothetical protein
MRHIVFRPAASNMKVLVIVLICLGVFGLLAVGACVGLGYFAFKTVTKELDAAKAPAETFFDQLKAGQFQAAYQSTTADFQAQQSFQQFSGFVALHPNLTGHTSRDSVGFNMTNVNGVKQAVLPYSFTGPTGVTNCTVTLQDNGGGWKVHRLTVP